MKIKKHFFISISLYNFDSLINEGKTKKIKIRILSREIAILIIEHRDAISSYSLNKSFFLF